VIGFPVLMREVWGGVTVEVGNAAVLGNWISRRI
jgi:hypothetical protein